MVNTGVTTRYDSMESGKIVIGGYVDTYYGFDFSQPKGGERPYAVSSSRHNEVNINLAYVEVKYTDERVRGRFVPGFGTYMNNNYAAEKGSLRNLVEANVGIKLTKKRDIWVDAGILCAPYTNETAISKDHLMYTRSFAVEYSPYYLAGVKLSAPIGKKLMAYGYVVNGWQTIARVNKLPSLATQVEYRPNDKLLLNWNTYIGNEESVLAPNYRGRYFTDVYLLFNSNKKWSGTVCAYAGLQRQVDSLNKAVSNRYWWQANAVAQYAFNKNTSLAGRVEWFNDMQSVLIMPITAQKGFASGSAGLCLNRRITKHALFRLENRFYFSDTAVYLDTHQRPTPYSNLLISNLTVWF